MKKLFTLILATGLGCSAFGQGTQLLRQPTLSQSEIVFVYANDLWKVSKSGGVDLDQVFGRNQG